MTKIKELPYLEKNEIEEKALILLRETGMIQELATKKCVEVEEILENHLGLALEVAPLGDDVFGGLYVAEKVVRVNETIYLDKDKKKIGIYNFTLAHECGHAVLHMPLLEVIADNMVLCRRSESYMQQEWQANFFASCLLMPKEIFIQVFYEMYDEIMCDEGKVIAKAFYDQKFIRKVRYKKQCVSNDAILEVTFEGIAKRFGVSPRAAVIRMKELGLLKLDRRMTKLAS